MGLSRQIQQGASVSPLLKGQRKELGYSKGLDPGQKSSPGCCSKTCPLLLLVAGDPELIKSMWVTLHFLTSSEGPCYCLDRRGNQTLALDSAADGKPVLTKWVINFMNETQSG